MNGTLLRMGKHSMGICNWCGVMETVEHVFINCRRMMRVEMGNTGEIRFEKVVEWLGCHEGKGVVFLFLSNSGLLLR